MEVTPALDPVMFITTMWSMAIILIFPIVTLVQCWSSPMRGLIAKLLWTGFIMLTWPIAAIGAFIFALTTYQGSKKLIPVILVTICIISGFTFFRSIPHTMQMAMTSQVDAIVKDPALKEQIKEDLKILEEEDILSLENLEHGDKSPAIYTLLMQRLIILSMDEDNLTQEEYQEWKALLDERHDLTDEKVKALTIDTAKQMNTKMLEAVSKSEEPEETIETEEKE